jgi:hypothetical protein
MASRKDKNINSVTWRKKKSTNSGVKKSRNMGVVIEMTTTTDRAFRNARMKNFNISGILVSEASMSFENLLSIRPIGVDSKNCMPQRSIECKRDSCKARAARVYMKTKIMSPKKANVPLVF